MKFYCLFLALSLFIQTPEMETLLTPTNALVTSNGHGAVDVVQGRHSVDVSVRGEGQFTIKLIRLADGETVSSIDGKEYGLFQYPMSKLGNGAYLVHVVFDDELLQARFWVRG